MKRPTAKETDDDLLHQQELFFQNKNTTAVKVQSKEKAPPLKTEDCKSSENQKCALNIQDNADVQVVDFSFDIKEQDVSSLEPFVFKPPPLKTVEVTNLKGKKVNRSQFSSKSKNKSIFAQILEKTGDVLMHTESSEEVSLISSLVDGSGLATKEKETELQKIHEENMAKLSSMSIEEIKQHQTELQSRLDPTVIQFIKSRRNQGNVFSHNIGLKSQQQYIDSDEINGEVLKKEGRNYCDALILEKVMEPKVDVKDEIPSSTRVSNKNIEIPEETKKLLESRDEGQWKNMSKIEKEKLEWISDLPSANPIDLKTGFTARFDFEGKLLAHDIETPTFKGLHHHGEEPEVAGYSLEELFLLARSTLQSQRITALHTIAHILDKYWHGMMDGCFDDPLLPTVLDAGIVPLLRWALDDTSLTSLAATITAIHSLLISKPDEICLQRTFCWLYGHIIPQMKPQDLEEHNIVLEELTDADLIKLDVVKAFLQMDILPRFSYILQVLQPPPLVCKLIIEICAHFARHSVESADQVARHSGLLPFIFEKFLPLKWHFVEGNKLSYSSCYKCPLPAAMTLVRLIVSSNKELAFLLVKKYDLLSNVTVYLTLQPSDGKVSAEDMQLLMIETLKTYHALLSFGIGFNIFLDLFSLFLKQMGFCLSLDMSFDRSNHLKDFEYATYLFKTFEAVTVVAIDVEDHQKKSPKAAIKVIFDKALLCLKKWLWQFPQHNPSDHGIMLLAGCMNFISTYFEKAHHAHITDGPPCVETTSVFQTYLLPFLQSEIFKCLLSNLESYSLLQHLGESGNRRDSKTIISLGSILWKGDVVPILKENSPIPLLLAIFRLLIKHKQILPGSDNACFKELMKNSPITEYLRKISFEKLNVYGWFTRYESYLLSQVLQLPSSMIFDDALITHKIASSLLLVLRTPDESIVEDIFENIIFNPFFLMSTEDETFKELIANLEVISLCYGTCLLNSEAVLHSRKLLNGDVDVLSLVTASSPKFLLFKDWFYTPILEKYQNSSKKKSDEQLNPDDGLQLKSCLEWIFLSHKLSLPVVKDIPAAAEFSYLCMLFLLDEDFFRKPDVKRLLEGCLLSILKYKKVKLSKFKWNTLNGFDDLYLEMLNQFEAVSYGDELFGKFLLFPLQQCYPKRWKQLMLTEHSQALCFLRVPLSKLAVPLRSYLEPFETDAKIILEYYKLLSSGALTFVRCPLLYVMAIHHVHHFIFSVQCELKAQQKSLISNILKLKRKEVLKHVLLYSEANIDTECGFTLKPELLASDLTYLSNIIGQPIILDI